MKRRLILYLILSIVGMAGLAIRVYSMVIENAVSRQSVEKSTPGGYNFGFSVSTEKGE